MQMLGIKAFPSLLRLGIFEKVLQNPTSVISHHTLPWGLCPAGREEAAEKLVSSVCRRGAACPKASLCVGAELGLRFGLDATRLLGKLSCGKMISRGATRLVRVAVKFKSLKV